MEVPRAWKKQNKQKTKYIKYCKDVKHCSMLAQ